VIVIAVAAGLGMGMAGFGVGGKEIKLEGAAAREHQSMMRMMKDMNAQQAAAAAAANGGKGDKDMLMAGNYGHISQNSERKFFDTVKEMLSSVSREAWAEFVRCLEVRYSSCSRRARRIPRM